MLDIILRQARKALTKPELMRPYFKGRIASLAYHFLDGSLAFKPAAIKLYVNNVCNASCLMCDVGTKNRESVFYRQMVQTGNNALSIETCRGLLEEVKAFKPHISISGLEPLLHEDILGLIALIKSHGLHLSLSTNGILMSKLASGMVERGIDSIMVSLDGPEPIHDEIRGMGVFKKTVEGIRMLRRYRTESGKTVPRISVNCCITPLNYGILAEFAEMALEEEHVDHVTFTHPYYVTEEASRRYNVTCPGLGESTATNIQGMDLGRIDIDILWRQVQVLKSRFRDAEVSFCSDLNSKGKLAAYYHRPEEGVNGTKCLIPWKQATVLANGDVVIHNRCAFYKTGNIHDASFVAIWNGHLYRSFRKKLRKEKLFPICARCCGTA